MLSARECMDIISAYREVGTYRGAAEICQTTHKTVRRVVERAEAGDTRPASKLRVRNYESVTELVWKRVDKSKGRISAKRLLPVAAAAGYQGSARNFRRLVAAQKRVVAAGSSPRTPTGRLGTGRLPGVRLGLGRRRAAPVLRGVGLVAVAVR